ncbi:MAG: AI-2E family transporter [Chroococcidiopsidaceae cyanobacterium CP_BM_ER_R8_30]|nr:AI-2E family transporter [Chroococcidiopsidaceae cyanobacterium CP_BM_ER_R8_30]
MTGSRDQDTIENQLTRGAPLALLMAIVIYILYRLVLVLEILAIAALIALVLRTSLRWLRKIVKARWLAVLILIGLIVGFWTFIVLFVIPNFITETQILVSQLPNYLNRIRSFASSLRSKYTFVPDISQALVQLRSFLVNIFDIFPLLLRNTFGGTIETIGTAILALYMAYDPNSVIRGVMRLVPRRHHERFRKLLQSAEVRLEGWIFGTGVAMLIIGVGAALGLWAIGVPLSVSFGVFAGVFEIIPYFGSIVGTILPALVALTISPIKAVFVVLLFLLLNQVDAHLVQPIIMGQRVKLSPVMVIVAFLVMGELLGFFGVLLAVPAAAVFATIIDEFTPEERVEDQPPPKLDRFNP